MATVRDILARSMRLLGISDPVEALTPEQGLIGLEAFNAMLDAWNADNLMVYTILRSAFALTPGKQSYTLGTGGDFSMPRPAAIENFSILLTGVNPVVEIPIRVLQDEDWRDITVKTVSSGFPTEVYPAGDYPLNTLYFWPIPTGPCSVALYTWNLVPEFTSLNDLVAFPPGYRDAFCHNLAVLIAPEFGLMASPQVAQRAISTKEAIQRINWTPREMAMPCYLRDNGGSTIGQRSRGAVVDP